MNIKDFYNIIYETLLRRAQVLIIILGIIAAIMIGVHAYRFIYNINLVNERSTYCESDNDCFYECGKCVSISKNNMCHPCFDCNCQCINNKCTLINNSL